MLAGWLLFVGEKMTGIGKAAAIDSLLMVDGYPSDTFAKALSKLFSASRCTLAVVPLHDSKRSHWTVAICTAEIAYTYDPLGAPNSKTLSPAQAEKLRNIVRALQLTANDPTTSTSNTITIEDIPGPRQQDGHSCGPFSMAMVAYFLAQWPMFAAQHARYIRLWCIGAMRDLCKYGGFLDPLL